LKVKVNRAATDGASPRKAHLRLPVLCEQRSEAKDARAHLTNEIVVSFERSGFFHIYDERLTFALNRTIQALEKLSGRDDVLKLRHVVKNVSALGEQACEQHLERRVLSTAGEDFAIQATAAAH
jgi:hypothetical protein